MFENKEKILIKKEDLNKHIVELLKDTNISASNKETRRLIAAGSIKINGKKCSENHFLNHFDPLHENIFIISVGKKNMNLIYFDK